MSRSLATLRIGLVAGEHSGDTLGAGLIDALREQVPGASFFGVGGPKMRAAGLECWEDSETLAVMGLTEVIKHLPRLLKLRRSLVERFVRADADAFVGIDAPDFNIGLAQRLRAKGLKTIQYVSPSVWAWRQGRVKTIAKACDRVLCLLPFEPEFYLRHNVEATFVGHPLAQNIRPVDDVAIPRRELGIGSNGPVLTVMPGSRGGEIARLAPDFLATAAALSDQLDGLTVLVPLASQRGADDVRGLIEEQGLQGNFRLSVGDANVCMAAADVLLLASGTAALEGLLHGKPMVVAYRLAPSTYRIVRALNLVKLEHFSLPNLLTAEPFVREFVQDAITPTSLSEALRPLFDDTNQTEMLAAFAQVREQLAVNADERAARAVIATATAGSAS
ncbi:MAG: lipid-A-disaccharide synthase [Pseudomonadota bacterium]